MDYVNTVGRVAAPVEHRVSGFADISAKTIFVALLALIVFTAVPYGTVEPWWKAFFICSVATLTFLALIESMVSGSWDIGGRSILIPLGIVTVFSFLQSVPFGAAVTPGIPQVPWNAISFDPYATQFFALQI